MTNVGKESGDCERCSIVRLAHELPPAKATHYVCSAVMEEIAACQDCADEARSFGLSVEPIPHEPGQTPEDHVPRPPLK